MKMRYLIFLFLFIPAGLLPQQASFARWSVTLEGVACRFDGDITQAYNNILPTSFTRVSGGATVEYNLTPAWSLGADYYYLPMQATGSYYSLTNKMHTAGIFSSFNLLRWFYPRINTRWGIHVTAGMGLAIYNVDYRTANNGKLNSIYGLVDRNAHFGDGMAATYPVGLLAEYHFRPDFALGLKMQCRAFNKDNLDGRNYWGVTNDYVELSALQLRWKLGTRHLSHVRNINTAAFQSVSELPKPQSVAVVQDITPLRDSINDVRNELDLLRETVAGLRLQIMNKPAELSPLIDAVYFGFDQTELDAAALHTIHLVADKLTSDSSLVVEVIGYADGVGNETYNQNLSQRRAEKVKNHLVSVYHIAAERITATGKGKISEPPSTTLYNRRCNFEFRR